MSGVVTTLAGNCGGTSGYADGLGTSATFTDPRSIAVIPMSNIIAVDSDHFINNNNYFSVRFVTLEGLVTTPLRRFLQQPNSSCSQWCTRCPQRKHREDTFVSINPCWGGHC